MKRTSLIGKVFLAVLFFSIFAVSDTYAQKEQYKNMFMELKKELQDFRNETIQPQMLEWKNKLDNAMDRADLDKLNELRTKANEFRDKMMQFRQQMRQETKSGEFDKKEFRKEMKNHRKEMKKVMKPLMKELKPLAEKYKSVLEDIMKEAEPKMDEWKDKSKSIVDSWKEKYSTELQQLKDSKKGEKFRHMDKRMGKEGRMDFELDNPRAVARFMLWDGTMPQPPEESRQPGIMGTNSEQVTNDSFRNYPNPFGEKTTIYFNLPKSEKVTLDIFDNTGKKITTLFSGELPEGGHSFVFNANDNKNKDLPSGTYIYKLTTKTTTMSGKMILTR